MANFDLSFNLENRGLDQVGEVKLQARSDCSFSTLLQLLRIKYESGLQVLLASVLLENGETTLLSYLHSKPAS